MAKSQSHTPFGTPVISQPEQKDNESLNVKINKRWAKRLGAIALGGSIIMGGLAYKATSDIGKGLNSLTDTETTESETKGDVELAPESANKYVRLATDDMQEWAEGWVYLMNQFHNAKTDDEKLAVLSHTTLDPENELEIWENTFTKLAHLEPDMNVETSNEPQRFADDKVRSIYLIVTDLSAHETVASAFFYLSPHTTKLSSGEEVTEWLVDLKLTEELSAQP